MGQVIAVPDEELRGERGTIERDYVFRVDQAVKGDLPETITVRSAIDGAACGLGQGVGVSRGVFLRLVDGHWTTNFCTDGNTLAYGAGAGEVSAYALCPGDRTVIQLVSYVAVDQRHSLIGVRDLHGFHVVREVVGEDVPGIIGVADIACLDPDGEEILLLVVGDELEPQNGRILRVRSDAIETVAKFPDGSHCNGQGAFDAQNGLANFTDGEDCRTLYRYDIEHGGTAEIARIPEGVASASLITLTERIERTRFGATHPRIRPA